MRELSGYSVADLASGHAATWKRVTIDGIDRTSRVMAYEFQYPDQDYAARASATLSNEDGEFTEVVLKGQVIQIEEGLGRPGGVV